MEYPTDTRLLFDAVRKVIELLMQLCIICGLPEWKEGKNDIKKFKKLLRTLQRLRHSTSKNDDKKETRNQEIIAAHQAYLEAANQWLQRAGTPRQQIRQCRPKNDHQLLKIEEFMVHAERQIHQTERRVIRGETLPHEEKVFSMFETHTEWLSKGKAGGPVELGLNLCILEDQYHFILHHHGMQKQTDQDVAVLMVQETRKRFPNLAVCSFDQGFHSPQNQRSLADLLELAVLPKKDKCSKTEPDRENATAFVNARRQHAAVESAINALEVHGLDRCPDRGLPAFKRHVALGVVASNIQWLGRYLRQHEPAIQKNQYQKTA